MAKKWIQKAIKHPGALHKQLGVPAGKKIPAKKLASAAKKGGTLGRRARLAETLKHMHGGSELLGRDSMKGRDMMNNRAFTLKDKSAYKAGTSRPDCSM
jgi:hypothetical protein